MSINREMHKEDMVHICNGVLAITKDEIGSFAETWMDLETVIQSEVSQRKILYIKVYMWNLEKWYRCICKAEIETQT